jgi:cell shape-determining protein MreC
MDIQTLTSFFLWCTIVNLLVYFIWVVCLVKFPDFVYNTQSRFFSISRDAFNTVTYAFLGVFKIIFLVFNVTPYITLLILRN